MIINMVILLYSQKKLFDMEEPLTRRETKVSFAESITYYNPGDQQDTKIVKTVLVLLSICIFIALIMYFSKITFQERTAEERRILRYLEHNGG